jgi:hypothetical protein
MKILIVICVFFVVSKHEINFKRVFLRFKRIIFLGILSLFFIGCADLTVKKPIIEPDIYWSDEIGGGCSYRFTDESREIMQNLVYLTDKIGLKEYNLCGLHIHSFDDCFICNHILCDKKETLILTIKL